MIDNFSLLLTHGLMLVAGWRLLRRPELDQEGAPSPFARFGRTAQRSTEGTPGA